jgi:hypothetical protein
VSALVPDVKSIKPRICFPVFARVPFGSEWYSCKQGDGPMTSKNIMTGDDLITLVTEAPTADAALDIALAVTTRAVLLAAADTLYIDDPEGHSSMTLRRSIVRVARA